MISMAGSTTRQPHRIAGRLCGAQLMLASALLALQGCGSKENSADITIVKPAMWETVCGDPLQVQVDVQNFTLAGSSEHHARVQPLDGGTPTGHIMVYVDDVNVTMATTTEFSLPEALEDGEHTLKVELNSSEGSEAEATADFVVDHTRCDRPTSYQVESWTDPASPMAGQEGEFWYSVQDQDGEPIDDLTKDHERMVHTFIISRDLSSFEHKHHEDYYSLTEEDLEAATFHYPKRFPYSGDYLLVFSFAHLGRYQLLTDWMEVGGDVAQLPEPAEDLSLVRTVSGVIAELKWDLEPIAGFESSWTLHLTDEEGQPITDLVQYLGADAHVAMVDDDLAFASHTHAWFQGIEDMPPGHTMPHLYDGPDIPFKYVFPWVGLHKIWIQFARADNPDVPYTVDFMFNVTP